MRSSALESAWESAFGTVEAARDMGESARSRSRNALSGSSCDSAASRDRSISVVGASNRSSFSWHAAQVSRWASIADRRSPASCSVTRSSSSSVPAHAIASTVTISNSPYSRLCVQPHRRELSPRWSAAARTSDDCNRQLHVTPYSERGGSQPASTEKWNEI